MIWPFPLAESNKRTPTRNRIDHWTQVYLTGITKSGWSHHSTKGLIALSDCLLSSKSTSHTMIPLTPPILGNRCHISVPRLCDRIYRHSNEFISVTRGTNLLPWHSCSMKHCLYIGWSNQQRPSCRCPWKQVDQNLRSIWIILKLAWRWAGKCLDLLSTVGWRRRQTGAMD